MKNNWYKDWFNTRQYLDLYKHRDDTDAKKIVTLLFKNISLPKGSACLDLACGNGRHSILFARKGFNVTGIDLSPFLIEHAKKRRKREYSDFSKNLRFEIGDMKHLRFINEFDLVVNLFTSFGYFSTDAENFKVIQGISKSLKKGGHFLFDFINKDKLLNNLVPYDLKKIGNSVFLQIRHIEGLFVVKNIFIIQNNKRGKTPIIHQFLEKIRLYSLNDFRKMFKKHRLKILSIFGDYTGEKFNALRSERLIILAKKE
ncbi:MAG TPA: class I SAM-dependent methyltransferase [Ignavibacteria bacterium]|nr:class I SAM-dependent methyltransferase [Ignavibacteria bacterium]